MPQNGGGIGGPVSNFGGRCGIVGLSLMSLSIIWQSCATQNSGPSAPPIPAVTEIHKLREAWQSCEDELVRCVELCPAPLELKASR